MKKTEDILLAARGTKGRAAGLDTPTKDVALYAVAHALLYNAEKILAANRADMERAKGKLSEAMLDRLLLTKERLIAMSNGVRAVAALEDPVGRVLESTVRPNGLKIEKVSVPFGVVAVIYESRPNVAADAAALCIKSGNVCVLRGGGDAYESSHAVVEVMREALEGVGLPRELINIVDDASQEGARALMCARGWVDLLIPRGGAELIRACVENATVPCIETGTGVCHIYVDKSANMEKALDIVENAKASRPSVCNAAEVCLVHREIAPKFLPLLEARLTKERVARGETPVELRLDARAAEISIANFSITSWRSPWWRTCMRRRTTLPVTPRDTARPSSPGTKERRRRFYPSWTARRCMSTRPPVLPTAANSGSAARWAFPRRSCTRAAPWGFENSIPINTESGATVRSGVENAIRAALSDGCAAVNSGRYFVPRERNGLPHSPFRGFFAKNLF